MNIDDLREALNASPNNRPLRIILANSLFEKGLYEEAESHFLKVLQQQEELKPRLALAQIWLKTDNPSTAIVFLEDSIEKYPQEAQFYSLLAKAHLAEDNIAESREAYEKALNLDPNWKDAELDEMFRLSGMEVDENPIDELFMEKPDLGFADVGGMAEVKREIALKIIQPLQHPELYKAYGKKIGGGILLYGPPGCGKTYIARATAGEINARFISISLNEILDMWIGNSEKNLHQFFEIARRNAPCVLFIDEVDALGASRSQMKNSAGSTVINQFLAEMDGIQNSNEGVLILGATNMPWNLDPAFRRPGRFDRILFVPPPDEEARLEILKQQLKDKPQGKVDFSKLASKTQEYSGADLKAIIDVAIEEKLEESFKTGNISTLETKDLLKGVKKHKATTKEWFSQAKNFALFANNSGNYDAILDYLKIKK